MPKKSTNSPMVRTSKRPNPASSRTRRLNDLKKNHAARGGKGYSR